MDALNAASAGINPSFLMWMLAAVTAVLTASVSLGWTRQAQLHPSLRQNWRATWIAAAVLGTGVSTVVLLAIAAKDLPFAIGYQMLYAPGLLLAGVVVCWPVLALLGCRPSWPVLVVTGLLLGLFVLGLTAAWVLVAGFRPGVKWHLTTTYVASGAAVVGMVLSLFMAFVGSAGGGQQRHAWRWAAAVLMAITMIGSHRILMAGANMPLQVGSMHEKELPSTVLSLVLGVLVPMIFSLLLLDLRLRRQEQRRLDRRDKRNRRHQELFARDSVSYVTKPPAHAAMGQARPAEATVPENGTASSPARQQS